jgi:RNA-directed DNA polymerase
MLRKSDESIVAEKSCNDDGAKGFCQIDADSDKGKDRLETTTISTPLNNTGLTESLALLRTKLFCKARKEVTFKFYSLFGHIVRMETLENAWVRVKKNRGSSGVDGIGFKDIEEQEGGVEKFLEELQKELKERIYKPMPVRRVYIPKPDGRLRPLGIPTIRDRVAQQAVLLIIEPIFEADFMDSSYGFRPNRNAHDAIREIQGQIKGGKRVVYDADLKGYFDTIPHEKLMKAIEARVVDGSVLKLIRMWLKSIIVEQDKNGKKKVSKAKVGTPQGGVISPLLANIYLHYFEKHFETVTDKGRKISAIIVRYADDFVILMAKPLPRLIHYLEDLLEKRFALTINREKTRWIDMRSTGETLDFLGYSFRYEKSRKYDAPCLSVFTSKKSEKRVREKISKILSYENSYLPLPEVAERLNRMTSGWSNYFSMGYKKKVYSNINHYLDLKFWKFCTRKSQRKMKLPEGETSWHNFAVKSGVQFLSYASP